MKGVRKSENPRAAPSETVHTFSARGDVLMCQQQYAITFEDLNPTFLFSVQMVRHTTEQPHSHDFIEIAIILDGEGEFFVDGQTFPVRKGDLLLFNPGMTHQSRRVDGKGPATEFYAAFTNIHFRDMEDNQIRFPGGAFLLHPEEKTFLHLTRLAQSMVLESCNAQPGRYFMLKAYLTQMILLLYREQVEDQKPKALGYIFESANKKYVVEQIVDYLNRHYNEKISLDQIAQNMYLSPFYISRIFKNEVGDTPINYLINLRMEKARKLLLEKQDCSIQEIAQCVGYDDAYHFSKLFKKHYGNSPSQYRARKSSKAQNPE